MPLILCSYLAGWLAASISEGRVTEHAERTGTACGGGPQVDSCLNFCCCRVLANLYNGNVYIWNYSDGVRPSISASLSLLHCVVMSPNALPPFLSSLADLGQVV